MTDQPDLPAELLERVEKSVHEHLCRRDIMQYLDNAEDCAGIARAVAPDLIAHGRELEKAEVVADIAAMMGEFVENWPEHKKISTSIALISKTLRISRTEPNELIAWLQSYPSGCQMEVHALADAIKRNEHRSKP